LIRKWNKIDGLDPVAGSTSNSIPVTEQQKPKKKKILYYPLTFVLIVSLYVRSIVLTAVF